MGLPEALQGNRWTEATARRTLPLLVWCAQNEKKITYGQLDTELQRRGWGHHVNVVVYGHPAGAIGSALLETEQETGEKIPPLNALIVNAQSEIPGSGCDYYLETYLEKYLAKQITVQQRKAMADETIKDVWRYTDWSQILEKYGLKPIRGGIPSLKSNRKAHEPRKTGWSNEPESLEHQRLKHWVAKNPSILKSKNNYNTGKTEWLFASADRVDVMFEHEDGCTAVEVKAFKSNEADLERGIYQCVKYEALLRAELKAKMRIPNGNAVLVTERALTAPLQNTADLLGVRVINVPVAPTNQRLAKL